MSQTNIQAEPQTSTNLPLGGVLIATWGVFGVLLLLGQACYRLGARAWDAYAMGLTTAQWGVFIAWLLFSAYGEGYRGFQKKFSPRVVARAVHLSKNPNVLHAILAPFFCMAMFHASKRGKYLAWGTTGMVLCFILLLRVVPQPWRGIVDGGVTFALAWGALAIVVFYVRAFFLARPPQVPALLPGD